MVARDAHGLRPALCTKLGVNVLQMKFHAIVSQPEETGNFLDGATLAGPLEDLDLASRQLRDQTERRHCSGGPPAVRRRRDMEHASDHFPRRAMADDVRYAL